MTVDLGSPTPGTRTINRSQRLSRRRVFLLLEPMEERTLLSGSPLRIGSIGDSLTDEYQFYTTLSTAQNWVEIISTLRSSAVTFGDFSTTTRGETRNQGFAQNWARAGATAVGTDVVGQGTTFAMQYNGNPSTGAPGLLTQPGGLSNIDVVTILIGGNDYLGRLSKVFDYTITDSNIDQSLGEVIAVQAFEALEQIPGEITTGVTGAVQAIRAENPSIPIVLISTPDVGVTPIVNNANATLNNSLPPEFQNLLLKLFHDVADRVTDNLKTVATDAGLNFIDLDSVLTAFISNPYVNGLYIDPSAAGPEYTDMFIGDGFHPGTVAQSVLANAIIGQLNAIFPNSVAPLSNSEVLAYARDEQPVTRFELSSSAASAAPGSPLTFTAQVFSYPNIVNPILKKNYDIYPPTGTVSFIDVAQGNRVLLSTPLRPVGNGPTYTQSMATFTTSELGSGAHEIIAVYQGDARYPAATSASVREYIGTPKQVQLFTFVTTFQTQLGVQINEPQVTRWNRRLQNGAAPQHVARSVMRYVYSHTQLPRGQVAQLLKRSGLAEWGRGGRG